MEQSEKLSMMEKAEMEWVSELKENRTKNLMEKLIQLKVSGDIY